MKLNNYIEIIRNGDIVAFPTETVYGLGADAWNPNAIQKVFKIKGRPSDNPLIVHISNIDQISGFTAFVSDTAKILIENFWPGPLSIILKKNPKVLDVITAGLDTVALRMPSHKLALDFIEATGPLVAPSANKSGKPSPTKAQHVKDDFGSDFPVIDGGATQVGLESTVLDLTSDIPTILRPGAISKDDLEEVLHTKVIESHASADTPKSPGQKYSHYKPNADVVYPADTDQVSDQYLFLAQSHNSPDNNWINYNGDLALLSRELYDRFRQADIESYSKIMIEDLSAFESSNSGLYKALINRIKKSSQS